MEDVQKSGFRSRKAFPWQMNRKFLEQGEKNETSLICIDGFGDCGMDRSGFWARGNFA
jgi:hypothetical protein